MLDYLEAGKELEKSRAVLVKAEELVCAVAAYFNKRGVAHSERKGNEDIAAMADALSDYGYAVNLARGPCSKGGEHTWGIDGAHSNEFCKKCYVSRRA